MLDTRLGQLSLRTKPGQYLVPGCCPLAVGLQGLGAITQPGFPGCPRLSPSRAKLKKQSLWCT